MIIPKLELIFEREQADNETTEHIGLINGEVHIA